MQNILSTVLFSLVPQLIDVLIGSTYLAQVGVWGQHVGGCATCGDIYTV